jgi:hypothetical protein
MQQGKQLATVLITISWSIPILALIATIINIMGYGPLVHYYKPRHFMSILLLGLLMFGPFTWLAWYQVRTLDAIPVSKATVYRKLAFITWSILIISFSMAVIIPLLGQKLFSR